jgi:hypothetical protein
VTLIRCPKCGEEHDLWENEIGFEHPDEVFALPEVERQARAKCGTDLCVLDGTRHFIRAVLSVPVRGERRDFGWGVWAEVSREAYARYYELWDSPNQSREPAFPGRLANALPGYETSLGLPLMVQLTSAEERPALTVADSAHSLAREQREGVYPERVLEWLAEYLH